MLFVVFFGGCSAVLVDVILRKRRARAFRALSVSAQGGRNLPISSSRLLVYASGLLAIGASALLTGDRVIVITGAIFALIGALIVVMFALGKFRHYLRFDPEGITFGTPSYAYQVPWDSIRQVRVASIEDSSLFALEVVDLGAIRVSPPEAAAKVHARIGRQGLLIAPLSFGFDAPVLLAALQRYVREPGARKELVPGLPGMVKFSAKEE